MRSFDATHPMTGEIRMHRPNTLKRRLAAGTAASAAWMFTGDIDAAEVLGTAGFDAIILDRQHTPVSLSRTREQLRAVRAAGGSTVLARLRADDPAEVAVLLDMGIEGLLLPDARSAAQVHDFVAATRYPPDGIRGAHDTVSRAAGWGLSTAEYRARYREDLLLIAMIESVDGAHAVADMADVDGLDMVFIGPLDLSASAGAIGEWTDERYVSALEYAEQAALGAGLLLGGALAPPGIAQDWVDRGHSLLSVGSDVTMIRDSANRLLGAFPPYAPPTDERKAHSWR
jgi:2-keto-3-deoxy-L-rhamnonate aldolase RhmA